MKKNLTITVDIDFQPVLEKLNILSQIIDELSKTVPEFKQLTGQDS